MTRTEMTNIFAVLMLAFPRADMFKGGLAQMGPTIELWTACTGDVDYWLGQQAVIRVCRECKFPPTIAEFREAATAIRDEIAAKAQMVFQAIRTAASFAKSPEELYTSALIGREGRAVIDAVGGPERIMAARSWAEVDIQGTYIALARKNTWLTGGVAPENVRRLEASK